MQMGLLRRRPNCLARIAMTSLGMFRIREREEGEAWVKGKEGEVIGGEGSYALRQSPAIFNPFPC
jgi:hypothetical protein